MNGARTRREARIFEAAYSLLSERGYAGTSMLNVARQARASNETLYRWYGDKRGLFARMVDQNAGEIRRALEAAVESGDPPLRNLREVAPVLLGMLLGEKAISLNRAAAADQSGELGKVIAAGGRETVAPLVELLMERAIADGTLAAPSPRDAAEWFFSLLIGDLQVRRVNRVLPEPDEGEIRARAAAAMSAFRALCGAGARQS